MASGLPSGLRQRVEEALGASVVRVSPLAGGDINQAQLVEVAGRERVFLKWNEAPPEGMFSAEARGLEYLSNGQASLAIPRVLATSEDFLVLEYFEPARAGESLDEQLGRGLAELHSSAPELGLAHDNFIGSLPQKNRAQPGMTWASFYAERRLGEQLGLPGAKRYVGRDTRRRFDQLFERIEDLVGPEQRPSRLHGDLWGGNWMATSRGPALFDPAVYGGNREVDLAMMQLFGGFSRRVFSAYDEAMPRAAGHEERVALYQLYPLLVHVNLFGSAYLAQLERALGHYV